MPSQPGSSNWQSQMAAQSTTPFRQPAISSHPGTYNWQSQIPSHMGNPNSKTPIETHPDAAGLLDQNRGKREQRPDIYRRTPYMEQPPTIVLPKQHGNKTKNKVHMATVLPLNLGNVFDDDNEESDDIMFVCGQFTVNILEQANQVGWLSGDHMNSWMELLIRSKPKNAPWTVAKTGTHRLLKNTSKDELRKAYEECRDIPLEQHALIENFLKIESELDYEMNNDLLLKAAMLEKQIRDKTGWIQQI
ncbi:hypothetical protein Tco_0040280 [Tanacetum coccineum]